jgi:hypothetical protein
MKTNPINKNKENRMVEPIAPIQRISPVKMENQKFDMTLMRHINDRIRKSLKEKSAMVTRISARDDDEANLNPFDESSDPEAIEDAAEIRENEEAEKRKQAEEDKGKGLSSGSGSSVGDDEEDVSSLGAAAEALDIKDLLELATLKQQLSKERKQQKRIDLIRKKHIAWMRSNKPAEVFKDWLKANFPELYIIEFEEKEQPKPTESIQVSNESPYPIGTDYTPEEEENLKDFWKMYEENKAKEESPSGEDEDFEVSEVAEAPLEPEEPTSEEDNEDFSVSEVAGGPEEEDALLSKEEIEKEKEEDKDIDFSSESSQADEQKFEKDLEEAKKEGEPKSDEDGEDKGDPKAATEEKKKKGRGEAYDKRVVKIPVIEDLATFAYLPSTADEYDYDTAEVVDSFGEDDEYNLGQLRKRFKSTIPKASPRIKEQIMDLIEKLYDYKLNEYIKTTRSKSGDKGAKEIESERKSELDQISRLNDLEAREIKSKLGEIQKYINRLKRKEAPSDADPKGVAQEEIKVTEEPKEEVKV